MTRTSLPDRQGRETAPVETGGAALDSRASFLRKLGLGAGVLAGGSVLLAPGKAFAGHGDTIPDVDILNYALTLEYLEATFYTQALGGSGTTGVPASPATFNRGAITGSGIFAGFGGRIRSNAFDYLSDIREHEITHVEFLRGQLGAALAVGPCTFDFSMALASVESFVETAQVLENTGVMAYDGAIRYVDAGDVLQAGAQIATVEARHAAYLNLIRGESPFPFPFDQGKKPSEIFTAASPYIDSCPAEVGALFDSLP